MYTRIKWQDPAGPVSNHEKRQDGIARIRQTPLASLVS